MALDLFEGKPNAITLKLLNAAKNGFVDARAMKIDDSFDTRPKAGAYTIVLMNSEGEGLPVKVVRYTGAPLLLQIGRTLRLKLTGPSVSAARKYLVKTNEDGIEEFMSVPTELLKIGCRRAQFGGGKAKIPGVDDKLFSMLRTRARLSDFVFYLRAYAERVLDPNAGEGALWRAQQRIEPRERMALMNKPGLVKELVNAADSTLVSRALRRHFGISEEDEGVKELARRLHMRLNKLDDNEKVRVAEDWRAGKWNKRARRVKKSLVKRIW